MQQFILKGELKGTDLYIAHNDKLSGMKVTNNKDQAMIFDQRDSKEQKEEIYTLLSKMYLEERVKFKAENLK